MASGMVFAYAGNVVPQGFLLCDGSSLDSRDNRYKNLFAAIGTAHGGDGNPVFNLPDYRGLFLRGVDQGRGTDPDANNIEIRRAPAGTSGNAGNKVGSIQ